MQQPATNGPSSSADASDAAAAPVAAGGGWRAHWYPVAFERDLRSDAPCAFTLFGEAMVAFRGADGSWFCGPDRCPHRAARLSEGRLRDGRLECLYHGWQFEPDGRCARIPQWPPGKPLPSAACLRRCPAQVRQGMLWVWPGDEGEADPARIPVVPALDAPDMTVVDYVIDLPYGQNFLIENVIDVAHIHVAHDGLRGGGHRDLALPLEFELLDESARGIRAGFRSIGLPATWAADRAGSARVEYVAPNLVHYTTEYVDRRRVAGLALYSLPLDVDRCRLLYRKYSNFYPWRERRKPRWLEHWTQNAILRQDMSLIIGQHEEIRRFPGELKDLWLPLKSCDTLVIRFRKWLDEHAADRPDHRGFASHRTLPVRIEPAVDLRDVFAMHTRQCHDCRRMHAAARRARIGLIVAMVAAVPAMAMDGGASGAIGLGVFLLAAAALWPTSWFRQQFERADA